MCTKINLSSVFTLIFVVLFISTGHANETTPLQEALALEPDLHAGEKIYTLCAACHGADGLGEQQGEFPSIAGQHKSVILKQLFDIQSKKRINPSMFPFSDQKTLGGLQGMADVSAYTASLTASAEHEVGETNALEMGEKLYTTHCIGCHGDQGQGNAELFYPRIRLQHYPYLVKEMKWIRDEIRVNANAVMVQTLKPLSDQQIQAVADYLSRLP